MNHTHHKDDGTVRQLRKQRKAVPAPERGKKGGAVDDPRGASGMSAR
ncbi:hypothetical protein [Streptomyces lycii]|uniref:Uncharacterized protein n=1 Tax=Streptomyces lycii TaxID=2654337 RepID=A0ABQ7FAI4_9ACTN|nr:hypothetical protein [Streptomyces lycii]KAF4405314.1 hypothetical protein GCU69_30960 [Streptomyces lycii]